MQLEKKTSESVHLLSVLEEERRNDQQEISRMRDQLQLFQREYAFYKEQSERLEVKGGAEIEALHR